ncbi:MAG: FG-GAP repeat domain-containing protein [Acetivibrionales bacterium]|jgi:hypothetical protein|nr:VCBS repeat-containing protein [Clostridiaceae bacterium]
MKKIILLLISVFLMFTGCTRLHEPTDNDNKNGENQISEETVKNSSGEENSSSEAYQSDNENLSDNNGLQLDESRKQECKVSSGKGQTITMPCGDNARLEISFVEGSVSEDTVFEITPIKTGKDGYPGFHLNQKGSNKDVQVDYPVSICYMTTSEVAEDLRIVKFNENGDDYIIVPTYRVEAGESKGLIAFVNSFSAYGVKKVTKSDIEHAADWHELYGFDWEMNVDDQYKMIGPDGTELFLGCNICMVNKSAPSSFTMQGQYTGEAILGIGAVQFNTGTFVEGMELPLAVTLFWSDRNANLELLPIFEKEEEADPLKPISLKHRDYVGKGILNLTLDNLEFMGKDHEKGDPGMVDDEPEPYPVSVVTRGPIAYVIFEYPEIGPFKFKGSIVGHGKKTEKELPQRIEIAPLDYNSPMKDHEPDDYTVDLNNDSNPDVGVKQDSNGRIEYDGDGDKKTDVTVTTDSDGIISYDTDGDGKPDIILTPLI